MRADRLLSLLMLLQSRGRMTAEALAAELEVSVRTIHRDVTALSTSGVPVYCERGPGGGIALVEEYRTTLTGMNAEETRALFMLGVPAPLAQLGMEPLLKAALLKLSAALPAARREDESRIRQRIHLDSAWWFQGGQDLSCLPAIQQALMADRSLHIAVRWEAFKTRFEQQADPYGLVAKAGIWYLVYGRGGRPHVVRVAEVEKAELLSETFIRPPGFDLLEFWENWCREYETIPPFTARVRVMASVLPSLSTLLGERFRSQGSTGPLVNGEEWVTLDLPFESFHAARIHLLGLGRAVEVLEPLALRKSIIDYAGQILDLYQNPVNGSHASGPR